MNQLLAVFKMMTVQNWCVAQIMCVKPFYLLACKMKHNDSQSKQQID